MWDVVAGKSERNNREKRNKGEEREIMLVQARCVFVLEQLVDEKKAERNKSAEGRIYYNR